MCMVDYVLMPLGMNFLTLFLEQKHGTQVEDAIKCFVTAMLFFVRWPARLARDSDLHPLVFQAYLFR
jgi:hypothetical protein